jgi:transcriptional regulator with XRE-family HTH domain
MDLGPDYVALGDALKRLREARGLTQTQAAEQIDVSQQTVSMAEQGARGLRWDTLLRFLEVYRADLAKLGREIKKAS